MSEPLWVGVDLGTQSVKVLVVSSAGDIRARASSPLTSRRDGPVHEQDPHDWIAATRSAMASAMNSLDEADRTLVSGVAVCATSGTITTVDATGAPLTPGLMYDDARAAELSAEVAAADPALWRELGYTIQPTWALPKIVWLERNGHLAVAGTRVAQQADVVAAALVGGPVPSDWSHALKSGFDLIRMSWPTSALAALRVADDTLPAVVAPGSALGETTAAWAGATGLPAGVAVFAGMTDGCAAQLGAATLALGDWHSVIGTTLVVKGVAERIVVDDSGAVYSHRSPEGSLWFPGGASNVGAGAVSAVLARFDLAELTREVAAAYAGRPSDIRPGYPLTGTGERFPVLRPDARGFVDDGQERLSFDDPALSGDPVALFASVMLGVACVERLSVETMERAGVVTSGTFSSSGGGTANRWWTALRATLLGRPISVPSTAEGALGMAILAAWACEANSTLAETARRMSRVSEVVAPDESAIAALDHTYAGFRGSLIEKGWLADDAPAPVTSR